MIDLKKDDDSDLSNDTPLSELMKQGAANKQSRSDVPTPKQIAPIIEPPEEIQSESDQQSEEPTELEEDEQITLNEEKIGGTVELLDNEQTEQEDYLESEQPVQSNTFDIKSSISEENPSKVEIKMPIDSFESDSNEEQSMENIQREIEELPELKDSNSSENSQDEKLGNDDVEVNDETVEIEKTAPIEERIEEENIEETIEKVETEPIENFDETIDEVKSTTEKDKNSDSVSINDEITDLTTTKDDIIEQSEPEKVLCDNEAEKSESIEIEKIESMESEDCVVESVESPEPEPKVEQEADSTAAENVVEILDDDILDEDDCMQETETQQKEEDKVASDTLPTEPDDLIEIKSDDEKLEENVPEEKNETTEEPSSSMKIELPEITERKEKSTTPAPPERKASTDDELFEDAKETLDVEVKPTKPATPAIICDTDDDSPIEVIKEEKIGVKRDYSRRKKEQSDNRMEDSTPSEDTGGSISSRLRLKDRDRSESPFIDDEIGEPLTKSRRRYSSTPVIDSLPNSPASSDDREYRSWKKSILLLYNRLANHRFASIFAKPITEDQAPNYKIVILNPMDLLTLKRNIDSGQIRSTIEFQRYVMLMCYNAIFYNVNDDITCLRAKEMLNDALQLIAEFQITWKKDNDKPVAVNTSSSVAVTKIVRGRKSNRLMN